MCKSLFPVIQLILLYQAGRVAYGDRMTLGEVAAVGVIATFRPARFIQLNNDDSHHG